ncbi:hypothetical protein Desdi_1944 [Desulfitobacterium dichloroeliminans LMG P-21439]|uniref:Uncharacterized protein n=1 Tax=Desulfitobacterium dichloroeliminans (strain LMG P-21439 / DCA1) TaxID=871963 RepID=L0F869_DESDL|nr:hypothetical protein [Desulfitobacterium dichloroeliminans]AGA69392.1 hypothetical protein Desdi_1944 [Desulfitobacterium dichloroeliminans LMG P-21439]
MRAVFTLTPSESKRLIAKGVKALPTMIKALQNHTLILAGGTTNAFLLDELLGNNLAEKSRYTVGMIAAGKLGESKTDQRIHPYVFSKGKPLDSSFHWKDYLPELKAGDIFIKGGNAVDSTGLAAVFAADSMGGTIGAAFGPLFARGVQLIVPIGLEKMIPDVREAVEFMNAGPVDEAMGNKAGLVPMLGATVVTEITALETLYKIKAKCIGAGGIAGSEGAITIVIEGEDSVVREALATIHSLKGEPPVR